MEGAPTPTTTKIDGEPGKDTRDALHGAAAGQRRRGTAPVRERSDGDASAPETVRALARLIGCVDECGPDPMRAAHVEILRNAVATGRYQPDLREVATKLLREVFATCRTGGRG